MPRRQSVSAILVNPRGEILLQQRDDRVKHFPLCWTTFGGAVEPGETPDEALKRELLEEIELTPEMHHWKTIVVASTRTGVPMIVEIYVYVGRINHEIDSLQVNEGLGAGYFDLIGLDGLPFAFGFELLFREFFAARELGMLPGGL